MKKKSQSKYDLMTSQKKYILGRDEKETACTHAVSNEVEDQALQFKHDISHHLSKEQKSYDMFESKNIDSIQRIREWQGKEKNPRAAARFSLVKHSPCEIYYGWRMIHYTV